MSEELTANIILALVFFRQSLPHFGKPPYDLKFPADKFLLLKCWQKGTDVNNWTWKNKQTCPVQINIDRIRSRPTQFCYISIFRILALKSGLAFKLVLKKLAMTPSLILNQVSDFEWNSNYLNLKLFEY